MTHRTLQNWLTITSQPVNQTFTVEPANASTSTLIGVKMSGPSQTAKIITAWALKAQAPALLFRHEKWCDAEYRQGYMEGSVEQGIAWQIRANRKARGLTQADLAQLLETTQSGVSRLEDPEYGTHSIDTLLRVANAFDCALSVKFVGYAQLAEDSIDLSEQNLVAPTYDQESQKYLGEQCVERIES